MVFAIHLFGSEQPEAPYHVVFHSRSFGFHPQVFSLKAVATVHQQMDC